MKSNILKFSLVLALAFGARLAQGQTVSSYDVTGYTYAGYTGSSDSNGASISNLSGTAYNIANYNNSYQNAIPASQLFTSSGPVTTPSSNPYLVAAGTFSPIFNTAQVGEIDYNSNSGGTFQDFLNPTSDKTQPHLNPSIYTTAFNPITGTADTISPSAIELLGTLNVTQANTVVTFQINHDEAYSLEIGNASASNPTYGDSSTITFTFATTGVYAFKLDLVNTDGIGVLDMVFGATSGAASIATVPGGNTGSSGGLAPVTTPEPGTYLLVLLAAAMLGGLTFARRQRA